MLRQDICICGGYWDWVKENPRVDWSTKPNFVPFEIDSPSKINGWVWNYICHENCEGDELNNEARITDALSELSLYFPGQGTSSSSSKKCTLCRTTQGANPPHTWDCLFRNYGTDPSPYE